MAAANKCLAQSNKSDDGAKRLISTAQFRAAAYGKTATAQRCRLTIMSVEQKSQL
jgi:hypothetical protein